jgi:hypothetical protein
MASVVDIMKNIYTPQNINPLAFKSPFMSTIFGMCAKCHMPANSQVEHTEVDCMLYSIHES